MEPYYGLIELIFSGGVVLGLGIFELVRVRRALRQDAERQKAGEAPRDVGKTS